MTTPCRVKVRTNGPFVIEGDVELLDADGNRLNPPDSKRLLLCRCGASKVKPFCDSSHYRVDFDAPPAEPGTEG